MISVVLLPLLLSTALPTPAATSPSADGTGAGAAPPVQVSLDHRTFERGDRARVTVRVRDDGYLVVLHLDPDGLVRVLFPLDPGDDNFVRGGQGYEIIGRGDREAFTIEASSGTGTVYAAWSREPFRFDDFVRGDHWDYRVITDQALPRDAEAGFTSLVQQMSGGHFDYDLVTYEVRRLVASAAYDPFYDRPGWCFRIVYDPLCHYHYHPFHSSFALSVNLVFGSPFRHFYGYARFYDPFFYDPFYYDPVVYDPFFYDPFYYHRYRYRVFYPVRPVVVFRQPRYVVYVPPSRYQWKGAPGGSGVGGGAGIQYRPRYAYAMDNGRPSTPIARGVTYRRPEVAAGSVARHVPVATARGATGRSVPVRTPERDTRAAPAGNARLRTPPRRVDAGTAVKEPARATPSERSRIRNEPRRFDRADRPLLRAEPRDVPRRDVPSRAESREGLRRVEPRAAPARPRDDGPTRAQPRPAPPPRVERYDPPPRVSPRSAPRQPVERAPAARPRPMPAPRRVEPRRAEPRVAPRTAPSRSAPSRPSVGHRGRRPS